MTRRTRISLCLAAVAILLPGGLCGCFVSIKGINAAEIREAADAFMDNLAAGRLDAAYDSTAPAMKADASREAFRAAYDAYPVLKAQDGRSIGNVRVPTPNQAEVLYQIPSPPNLVTMSVSLRSDGGRWRVQGFGRVK